MMIRIATAAIFSDLAGRVLSGHLDHFRWLLLIFAGFFFNNFLPKGSVGELVSAGVLPLYNIFVGTEVAASIFIIFLSLIIFKEESPQ